MGKKTSFALGALVGAGIVLGAKKVVTNKYVKKYVVDPVMDGYNSVVYVIKGDKKEIEVPDVEEIIEEVNDDKK